MKNEIKVPSLGESISEAIIGQILAPSGTSVKIDAELLELETDKVNQVLYAPNEGKVTLTVKSGDTVKIGQTIGFIETEQKAQSKDKPKQESKVIPPEPKNSSLNTSDLIKKSEDKKTEPEEINDSKPTTTSTPSSGIRYTKESFVNDLQNPVTSSSQSEITEKLTTKERETRRPMSRIRKVIAQRMVEAQQTMAMLTTFNEVDLNEVIRLREKYKEVFLKKYGCKLGFMSFFVKATVSALKAFPDLNSYIDGNEIVHREYYDIGIAVGTDKGVIVPIVRNCDQLGFSEIEKSIEKYAKMAREGTLKATDLQGGGFTITNGGTYGSLLSTPILLPPQCGILGMHKIEKRPVVIDNEMTIRSMMYIALSYDHRLIDGKEAVSFLVHLKEMLEDPSRLLLDI